MIETAVLLSLWAFIILMVGTPGPANLLAMSVGARYGFLKCVSFNIGLTLGKVFLNLAMGFGLGVLLVNFTTFQDDAPITNITLMYFQQLKIKDKMTSRNQILIAYF